MNEAGLKRLKEMLEESRYTVALCGSGMMEEVGLKGLKWESLAYEMEEKYGETTEELFHIECLARRPELFFSFYREEILKKERPVSAAGREMAAMERAGKLQCTVTVNLHNMGERLGMKNVINLHGTIDGNYCMRCKKRYSMAYVRDYPGAVPICGDCRGVVRPEVSLFGEMVDSQVMSRTAQEVERADMLLLVGTSLSSDVYSQYIRYFGGDKIAIINRGPRPLDEKADLVIYGQPQDILPHLGYESGGQ